MATVNLGRIKFVWQGAYNGATAYVADDVVSYNGSSYICILASTGNLPTNTTYWNLMAQTGTDITSIAGLAQGDVLYYNGTAWVRLGAGTSGQYLKTNGASANPSWANGSASTLTTQGDILYRDASGLARLGAGTSGQFLKTNGAGANPAWAAIDPAAIVKVGFVENSTRYSLSDSADTALFTVTFAKSLAATVSKVHVIGQILGRGAYSDWCGTYFDCLTSGMSTHNTNDSSAFKGISMSNAGSASRAGEIHINKVFQDTSNFTATTHTFEFGWRVRNGDAGNKPFLTINPNSSDDNRSHQLSSTFTFFEVLI